MKLPRDLDSQELARLLARYGYQVTRQTGSHLRLTSSYKGASHHITIPRQASLRVGTLSAVLADVARYIEVDRARLAEELFGSQRPR